MRVTSSSRLLPALGLLLASCASTTGLVTTPFSETWVENFEPHQRRVLEDTLRTMAAIAPDELTIPVQDYRSTTRFSRVFGFDLDGERLVRWWARRAHRLRRSNAWTVAVYDGDNTIIVTDEFFTRSLIERIFVLIHEARHADGGGYRHTDCPNSSSPACDDRPDGAYSFQAALLYELYAYGLLDAQTAHREWRATRRRIMNRQDLKRPKRLGVDAPR